MFRPSRHRLPARPRVFVMLLLAVGLVAQPVLEALGAVHEMTAHAATAGGHHEQHAAHESGASPAVSHDRDAGDLVHQLVHVAGCCGHCIWLARAEPTLPALGHAATLPPSIATPPRASARASTPFRPPIST